MQGITEEMHMKWHIKQFKCINPWQKLDYIREYQGHDLNECVHKDDIIKYYEDKGGNQCKE